VAALEYRDGRPTYRVVPGTVGESHALAAARRIGIDEALIERARELMDAGERALHDALAALEAERDRAAREAARVAQAAADLALREDAIARRERTVEAKETKIRGRARELDQAEARALLQRLRAADEEVRAALSALQRSPGREEAAAAREAITAAREVATPAPPAPVPLSRPLVVGDRVRVLRLGAIGDVVALRDDALEVRAGAMTMRVRTADVELVGAAPRAGQASGERRSGEARPAEARAGQAVPAAPQTVQARSRPAPGAALESSTPLEDLLRTDSNTLDLRGVRVEEGLELLANFLDESLLAGRDAVFVLHGHGTGAMKAAVRRALGDSRYVASSAPAADVQGGDALTVARLRG